MFRGTDVKRRSIPDYPRAVHEQEMVVAGRILRRVGAAALATGLRPSNNLRITLTHNVPSGELENFARIVDQVRSERRVVDPTAVLRAFADRTSPTLQGETVLFTFDDGLLSSFTAAQSILNPRGIKAIFFVPTGILGFASPDEMRDFFRRNVYRRPRVLSPDEYVTMTADHLCELHAQGHMVLPHTHSHSSLRSLTTPEDLDREVRKPKLLLEDMLGGPVEGFAFPIGTERVVSALAYEAVRGTYAVCFTGLGGVNTARTDPYCLHRDCVHPYYLPVHVANVMAGSFDLYYQHKMRRLKRRTRLRAT